MNLQTTTFSGTGTILRPSETSTLSSPISCELFAGLAQPMGVKRLLLIAVSLITLILCPQGDEKINPFQEYLEEGGKPKQIKKGVKITKPDSKQILQKQIEIYNQIGITADLEEKNSWSQVHKKKINKPIIGQDLDMIKKTWDNIKQDDFKFKQKDSFRQKPKLKSSPRHSFKQKQPFMNDFAARRVSLQPNGHLKQIDSIRASHQNLSYSQSPHTFRPVFEVRKFQDSRLQDSPGAHHTQSGDITLETINPFRKIEESPLEIDVKIDKQPSMEKIFQDALKTPPKKQVTPTRFNFQNPLQIVKLEKPFVTKQVTKKLKFLYQPIEPQQENDTLDNIISHNTEEKEENFPKIANFNQLNIKEMRLLPIKKQFTLVPLSPQQKSQTPKNIPKKKYETEETETEMAMNSTHQGTRINPYNLQLNLSALNSEQTPLLKVARTPLEFNEHRKKAQNIYFFRDNDQTMKKHNDVVFRTFGKRSLSHVAETQQQINERVHQLVPPNKKVNFNKKLADMQQEMNSSFYSKVSDINTTRSTARQQGTFQSTLQYGTQMNSIIADNRQTSLFRDYYKVIGSRYKFQLEDLIEKQKNGIPDEKFQEFRKRLSAHFMAERNAPSDLALKYVKYREYGETMFQIPIKQRSPRMYPKELFLDCQRSQTATGTATVTKTAQYSSDMRSEFLQLSGQATIKTPLFDSSTPIRDEIVQDLPHYSPISPKVGSSCTRSNSKEGIKNMVQGQKLELLKPGTMIIKKLTNIPTALSAVEKVMEPSMEAIVEKHQTLRLESKIEFNSRNHEDMKTSTHDKQSPKSAINLDMIWNETIPAEDIIQKLKYEQKRSYIKEKNEMKKKYKISPRNTQNLNINEKKIRVLKKPPGMHLIGVQKTLQARQLSIGNSDGRQNSYESATSPIRVTGSKEESGEKLTLLQRVASPLEQLLRQSSEEHSSSNSQRHLSQQKLKNQLSTEQDGLISKNSQIESIEVIQTENLLKNIEDHPRKHIKITQNLNRKTPSPQNIMPAPKNI